MCGSEACEGIKDHRFAGPSTESHAGISCVRRLCSRGQNFILVHGKLSMVDYKHIVAEVLCVTRVHTTVVSIKSAHRIFYYLQGYFKRKMYRHIPEKKIQTYIEQINRI